MSHTLECTFKRETENAVLVIDHDSGEEVWFPLSQVEQMHKDTNGKGKIVVSDWIAKAKGIG